MGQLPTARTVEVEEAPRAAARPQQRSRPADRVASWSLALLDGSLSQEDFANGAERWLVPQWVSEEKRLRDGRFPTGSPREDLRAEMIGVTANWRNGLEAYATGLRQHDSVAVHRAFAYIGVAEEAERSARQKFAP